LLLLLRLFLPLPLTRWLDYFEWMLDAKLKG